MCSRSMKSIKEGLEYFSLVFFSVLIGQIILLVEKFLNPILANGGLFDQVKEVSDPV